MTILDSIWALRRSSGRTEILGRAAWITGLRDPSDRDQTPETLYGHSRSAPKRRAILVTALFAAGLASPGLASPPIANAGNAADPAPATVSTPTPLAEERVAFHAQFTVVSQGNLPFRAPYRGDNSLDGNGEVRETADVTFYAGYRPWAGGELWVNPEIDQGFGLRNTLGAAGFPSAEAYKVGKAHPYGRIHRLFFRQTIGLGGQDENVAADLNQLAGTRETNRIVLTVGKFSVVDIFDNNKYAHDPRHDFLNWSVVDAGSMDYAADAWGYTYGAAAEYYRGNYTLRAGLFDLSTVPNTIDLETDFRQFQGEIELEARHSINGHPGAVRVTGFLSRGNMARLDDAVAYAKSNGTVVDPVPVRRFQTSLGVSVSAEQELSNTVGVFARAGIGNGKFESFEFTDIDRTVSFGISIKGTGYGRPNDTIGVAGVVNSITAARRRFLDAGGLGVLVGDGKLPHPGDEHIVEAYYDFGVYKTFHLALDAQLIHNPAYNRDRGPVPVIGVRAHAQF